MHVPHVGMELMQSGCMVWACDVERAVALDREVGTQRDCHVRLNSNQMHPGKHPSQGMVRECKGWESCISEHFASGAVVEWDA